MLTLWRWAADTDTVNQIFDENRGRCYEKILLFSTIVCLVRDALLEYGGSGQQSFEAAEDRGELDASVRAAYGKLGRTPIPVSSAFLAGCTARLQRHLPRNPTARTPLPKSLDEYEVVVFDGKAIKRVAKRLKALWGAAGGLLGGRALVALNLRTGWPWPCGLIPMAMPTRSASSAIWCPKCGD